MSSRSSRERRRQENWQERRERQGLHRRNRGAVSRRIRDSGMTTGSVLRAWRDSELQDLNLLEEARRNGWVIGVAPSASTGVETTGYSQPVPAPADARTSNQQMMRDVLVSAMTSTSRDGATSLADYTRSRLRQDGISQPPDGPRGLQADSYSYDEVQAIRGVSLPGVVYDEMEGIQVPEDMQARLARSVGVRREELQEASRRWAVESQATAPRNGSTERLTPEDIDRAYARQEEERARVASFLSRVPAESEAVPRSDSTSRFTVEDLRMARDLIRRGRVVPEDGLARAAQRQSQSQEALRSIQFRAASRSVGPAEDVGAGTFDGSLYSPGRPAALNEAIQQALRPFIGRNLTPGLLVELERVTEQAARRWEEQQEAAATLTIVATQESGIAIANTEGLVRATFDYQAPLHQTMEDTPMSRTTPEESPLHDDAGDAAILAAASQGERVERPVDAVTGMPVLAENERLALFPVMGVPAETLGAPVTFMGEPLGIVVGVDHGIGPDHTVTATLQVDGSAITARMGSPSGVSANGDSVSPAAFQDQLLGRMSREMAEDADRRAVDNLIAAFNGDRVQPRHFSMQYRELGGSTPDSVPARSAGVVDTSGGPVAVAATRGARERTLPLVPNIPGVELPDIRQILSDNAIRDMATEDDQDFFSLTAAPRAPVAEGELQDAGITAVEPVVEPLAEWRELAEQLAPTNAEDDNAVQLWRNVSLDPRTALHCLAPVVEGVTYDERARQAVSILVAIQQLHEVATASGNRFTAASAIQALTHLALGGEVPGSAAAKVPNIWSAAHKAGRAVFVEKSQATEARS